MFPGWEQLPKQTYLTDIHSLLAEIAQAHLLRWHSAHSQVGEMLAIGHKCQVTMGLTCAASVII